MIAQEGLVPIAVVGISAVAVAYFAQPAWSIPLWALLAYLVYLFREFMPAIPNLPLAVLSPGDGRIVEVVDEKDPWLERSARRVRVMLDGLGVGVLRSPVEGKVMDFWTSAQPFKAPSTLPATGSSPKCYSAWVQTDEGDDIVFAVSSLRPLSRFKLYCAPGERIGFGQRVGFVYFGNVVDVFMPSGTRAEARAGDAAVSGSTVLGELTRDADAPRDGAESG